MNAPVDGFTWPTEPPNFVPPIVVGSPLRYSVPDRCAMDSEFPILLPAGQLFTVGSHSFPVDTHTSLSVDEAATLDQTAPPIDPFGTVNQVCSTWPVCWSSSTTPPRMSGSSQFDASPT